VSDLSYKKFYEEHFRCLQFPSRPHRSRDICEKLIVGALKNWSECLHERRHFPNFLEFDKNGYHLWGSSTFCSWGVSDDGHIQLNEKVSTTHFLKVKPHSITESTNIRTKLPFLCFVQLIFFCTRRNHLLINRRYHERLRYDFQNWSCFLR